MKKYFLLMLLSGALESQHTMTQADYVTEIKSYSSQLYASLSKLQKQAGLLSFNDTSRLKWTPVSGAQGSENGNVVMTSEPMENI